MIDQTAVLIAMFAVCLAALDRQRYLRVVNAEKPVELPGCRILEGSFNTELSGHLNKIAKLRSF